MHWVDREKIIKNLCKIVGISSEPIYEAGNFSPVSYEEKIYYDPFDRKRLNDMTDEQLIAEALGQKDAE